MCIISSRLVISAQRFSSSKTNHAPSLLKDLTRNSKIHSKDNANLKKSHANQRSQTRPKHYRAYRQPIHHLRVTGVNRLRADC